MFITLDDDPLPLPHGSSSLISSEDVGELIKYLLRRYPVSLTILYDTLSGSLIYTSGSNFSPAEIRGSQDMDGWGDTNHRDIHPTVWSQTDINLSDASPVELFQSIKRNGGQVTIYQNEVPDVSPDNVIIDVEHVIYERITRRVTFRTKVMDYIVMYGPIPVRRSGEKLTGWKIIDRTEKYYIDDNGDEVIVYARDKVIDYANYNFNTPEEYTNWGEGAEDRENEQLFGAISNALFYHAASFIVSELVEQAIIDALTDNPVADSIPSAPDGDSSWVPIDITTSEDFSVVTEIGTSGVLIIESEPTRVTVMYLGDGVYSLANGDMTHTPVDLYVMGDKFRRENNYTFKKVYYSFNGWISSTTYAVRGDSLYASVTFLGVTDDSTVPTNGYGLLTYVD